jgi:hypothetical protein
MGLNRLRSCDIIKNMSIIFLYFSHGETDFSVLPLQHGIGRVALF